MYSFLPSASDPDNDSLTFSASGLPAWASVNRSTGKISGTPSAGDIGASSTIQLSVSDGRSSASITTFRIYVVATALGAATLSWAPPTERSDGSPLTDLAGYKVHWGMSPDELPNSATIRNPGVTTYIVEQLTPATWYFATTAFDSEDFESGLSNIASKTL